MLLVTIRITMQQQSQQQSQQQQQQQDGLSPSTPRVLSLSGQQRVQLLTGLAQLAGVSRLAVGVTQVKQQQHQQQQQQQRQRAGSAAAAGAAAAGIASLTCTVSAVSCSCCNMLALCSSQVHWQPAVPTSCGRTVSSNSLPAPH
jgi:hypothetical protein